ncbi:MAG: DUF481 domain-containing protein [Bacteroidetes bacterium]|nr:DUF481 domain-containing protein [Bacteroidota bacterium]
MKLGTSVRRGARFIITLLAAPLLLQAQVNTEAMRRELVANGVQSQLGATFEYASGNNTYADIGASYRFDLRSGPVYAFLVANYNRGASSDDLLHKTDLYQNDGFAHIRCIYSLDSVFRPEAFVQKEFNDFILLRDRDLAGAGLRMRLLNLCDSTRTLQGDLGIGGMFEYEHISSIPEETTRLFRSTNYIALRYSVAAGTSVGITTYYQIAPKDPHDFRVLADANLTVQLSTILSFTTSAHYRYDNDPPPAVKHYDMKIANGLGVTF